MLKTYRIIPLVFILFLFGFTLFTVAPVFAQSTQENESRINALEELLCSLHPEAGTEKYSVCDVAKQSGRVETDSVRQMDRAEAERVRLMEAERVRMEAERVRQMEEAEIAEYGNILPEAERAYVTSRACPKFPEARSHQECRGKMKGGSVRNEQESKRESATRRGVCVPDPNYDGKRFCPANPDARSYQECVGRCQ
jgi:hypothetical protein